MFFEKFDLWSEELLGLLAGMCIVLVGALIYVLIWMQINLLTYIPLALMIVSSGAIAYLFQLPRLKDVKSGVATLLGGLMIGVAIVFYAIMGGMENQRSTFGQITVWGVGGAILVLSFFAVGFIILAVHPEGEVSVSHKKAPKKAPKVEKEKKKKIKEKKDESGEEDMLERIERL